MVDSGFFLNELPYVSAGEGPDTFVIFPHIRDTLEDIINASWCRRWLKRFSKKGHRVYIIGRRNSLPPGATTREMARDYASVFDKCLGPASIMGVSLGGLIAQHFAVDYPQYVKSLVLTVSAHIISTNQQDNLKHWIVLAQDEDWKSIYLDIASLMHTGVKEIDDDQVAAFLGSKLDQKPYNPSNFITSVQASLDHNTSKIISKIQARTLLIGGTRDSLFPVPILREASQLIPDASLTLLEETGHGAFDERKRDFDRAVFEFLATG